MVAGIPMACFQAKIREWTKAGKDIKRKVLLVKFEKTREESLF